MGMGFITSDIYETKKAKEKYIGKWVNLFPQGLPSLAGYFKGYDLIGDIILQPSQHISYRKGDGGEIIEKHFISNKPKKAPFLGTRIDVISRKSLEALCEKLNKNNHSSKNSEKS